MTFAARPGRQRTAAHSKRVGMASQRGRFLRMHDMVASTSLSESTIRRKVKSGELPPLTSLTTRCVGWWEDEYAAWVAAQRRSNLTG